LAKTHLSLRQASGVHERYLRVPANLNILKSFAYIHEQEVAYKTAVHLIINAMLT